MASRGFGIKLRVAVVFTLAMLHLFTRPSASLSLLGPKSTASQVYIYLSQESQLAPYVGEGSTAVVTGGNSGIGVETVKTLAEAGMNVVLCARNVESANAVKKSLPSPLKERVDVQYMDLSNLASVEEASQAIRSKYKSIDCLVNNAGIMALKTREMTKDGIELQFGTNHVGHHYLTRLLLPILTEHGRVVTVASTAHTMARNYNNGNWESKTDYSPWGAYSKSKLANILFAKSLQGVMDQDEKHQKSVSLHPGVIKSPLWKHTLPKMLQPLVNIISDKNIEQGAATSVYCALAAHVEGGAYYDDCAVAEPKAYAKDVSNRNQLWSYTESLLAEKGFEMPPLSVSSEKKESLTVSN